MDEEQTMVDLDVDCSCSDGSEDSDGFEALDVDCKCPPEPPAPPPPPKPTTFREMYDYFLSGITDDMFMELTPEDTEEMLEEILTAALPHFEFPHKDIYDLDRENKSFRCRLSLEEMTIIRLYMIVEWLGFQLASVDNVRQKYSGSDFKFTSQASHMDKLTKLKEHYQDLAFKQQRIYCRHMKGENADGYVSTMGFVMSKPADDRFKLNTVRSNSAYPRDRGWW
jgi:hypothetical protein